MGTGVGIPSQFAHYEVLEQIGEGGMGVVFKARDLRLDRLVALKFLPGDATVNPDRRRRFVQEARAASALSHPGIITIYDIGEEGGFGCLYAQRLDPVTRRPAGPPLASATGTARGGRSTPSGWDG